MHDVEHYTSEKVNEEEGRRVSSIAKSTRLDAFKRNEGKKILTDEHEIEPQFPIKSTHPIHSEARISARSSKTHENRTTRLKNSHSGPPFLLPLPSQPLQLIPQSSIPALVIRVNIIEVQTHLQLMFLERNDPTREGGGRDREVGEGDEGCEEPESTVARRKSERG